MNKFRKLLVAGSIVTLLGITGCEKKQITPVEETQETPKIQRIELIDGYKLTQEKPYMEFRHNNIRNYDDLWFGDSDRRVYIMDKDCDGVVDLVASHGAYKRGEPGTDEIFEKADKDLEAAKKELGVK